MYIYIYIYHNQLFILMILNTNNDNANTNGTIYNHAGAAGSPRQARPGPRAGLQRRGAGRKVVLNNSFTHV